MAVIRIKRFGDVTAADLRDLATTFEERVNAAKHREPPLATVLREDGAQAAANEVFLRDFIMDSEEYFVRKFREHADYLEDRVVAESGEATVGDLYFLGNDETTERLYERLMKLLTQAAQVGYAVEAEPDEDAVAE